MDGAARRAGQNGIDHTEPAIIKMLIMARRASERDMVFGDAIAELKLVPVSISYEYDPCDVQKAQELHDIDTQGSYAKEEFEDIRSIVAGITGSKGRVRLHFGTPCWV
ncbi:hypothetical protein HSBAA_28660 [Vreelandella sulfidaeris]|uniref:Uncharacterized protein n=1 Tax=Vreelandella sulfidaeris TaxID=115553 RepID=A0A455U5X8_9GAMM|nr:hypothetical protein HSBAA_28660 [Halomonas sulfidaeris]